MDLKRLRYFVAIADAGSFTAGAQRAFVTQPTLSSAIAALEAELKGKLLERRARGVALTPFGQRVLVHARAMLREAEALGSMGRSAVPRRPLRLGLLRTLAPVHAGRWVGRLMQASARPWTVEDADLAVLRNKLASGRFDAILTSLQAKPPAGTVQLPLLQDQQVLALPMDWPLPRKVTPAVLRGRALIVRTHCELLQAASRILDEWKVSPVVVARTQSDERAMALVAEGVGACLLPDSLPLDGLRTVRPSGVKLARNIGMEWIRGAADGWLDCHADALRETP